MNVIVPDDVRDLLAKRLVILDDLILHAAIALTPPDEHGHKIIGTDIIETLIHVVQQALQKYVVENQE